MPGLERRARLLIDWTVTASFGRDTIELGQPEPGLDELESGEQSASSGRFADEPA